MLRSVRAWNIHTVTVDGAMLASRDFGFMLIQGCLTMIMQLVLLKTWCTSLSDIFTTFTLRLGSYATFSLIRAALGRGKLGRALHSRDIFNGTAMNGINGVNGSINGQLEKAVKSSIPL
jgi:hypothetical protein